MLPEARERGLAGVRLEPAVEELFRESSPVFVVVNNLLSGLDRDLNIVMHIRKPGLIVLVHNLRVQFRKKRHPSLTFIEFIASFVFYLESSLLSLFHSQFPSVRNQLVNFANIDETKLDPGLFLRFCPLVLGSVIYLIKKLELALIGRHLLKCSVDLLVVFEVLNGRKRFAN